MTDPVQITGHADRGAARQLAKLTGKPRLEAMLRSWLDTVQELEDVVFAMRSMMLVSEATGWWLERLGKLVGQPREGRTDDVYRVWIAARTLVNRSSGTAPQLIAIVEALTPDGTAVYVEDQYPAAMVVHAYGVVDLDTGNAIAELLQRARCPGVGCQFHWEMDPDANLFRFSASATVAETNVDHGFGSGVLSAVDGGAGAQVVLDPLTIALAGATRYLEYSGGTVTGTPPDVDGMPNLAAPGPYDLTAPGSSPQVGMVGLLPGVVFTSPRYLHASDAAACIASLSRPVVWVTGRFDGLAGSQAMFDVSTGAGNTGFYFHYYATTGSLRGVAYTPEGAIDAQMPFADVGGNHVLRFGIDATGGVLAVDGVEGTPDVLANTGLVNALTDVTVGALVGGATWRLGGCIADILIVDGGPLSPANIAEIDALLMAQAGIS